MLRRDVLFSAAFAASAWALPLQPHASQRAKPAYEGNFKIVRAIFEQPESRMDLASIKLTIDRMI